MNQAFKFINFRKTHRIKIKKTYSAVGYNVNNQFS